mgnify:FL=1
MRLELIKNNKFNLTDEPILFLENFLKKLSYEFLSYYNDFEEKYSGRWKNEKRKCYKFNKILF